MFCRISLFAKFYLQTLFYLELVACSQVDSAVNWLLHHVISGDKARQFLDVNRQASLSKTFEVVSVVGADVVAVDVHRVPR